jgi:hypothetical protein
MAITAVNRALEATPPVNERLITEVRRSEDGWAVEVEDARGQRLWYWLAGWAGIPQAGDRARFHGGVAGQPLRKVEINGRTVF